MTTLRLMNSRGLARCASGLCAPEFGEEIIGHQFALSVVAIHGYRAKLAGI